MIKEPKMLTFVAIFDNYVTDDIIMRKIRAASYEEADKIAYQMSVHDSYLSAGNYDLYVDALHLVERGIELRYD